MPLVVDYLRLKFGAGLPNPFRETDWRREDGRIDRDLARFMLDEDESKLRVYILQGGCADSPRQVYTSARGRAALKRRDRDKRKTCTHLPYCSRWPIAVLAPSEKWRRGERGGALYVHFALLGNLAIDHAFQKKCTLWSGYMCQLP